MIYRSSGTYTLSTSLPTISLRRLLKLNNNRFSVYSLVALRSSEWTIPRQTLPTTEVRNKAGTGIIDGFAVMSPLSKSRAVWLNLGEQNSSARLTGESRSISAAVRKK